MSDAASDNQWWPYRSFSVRIVLVVLTVSRSAVITERCRYAVITDSVLTVSAITDTVIADTVALVLTATTPNHLF